MDKNLFTALTPFNSNDYNFLPYSHPTFKSGGTFQYSDWDIPSK